MSRLKEETVVAAKEYGQKYMEGQHMKKRAVRWSEVLAKLNQEIEFAATAGFIAGVRFARKRKYRTPGPGV